MRRYLPYRKIYFYEGFWENCRGRSQTLPNLVQIRDHACLSNAISKTVFLGAFSRLPLFGAGFQTETPGLLLRRRNSFPFFIEGTKSDFCLSEIVAQSRETVHVPRYIRLTHLLRDLIQSTLG